MEELSVIVVQLESILCLKMYEDFNRSIYEGCSISPCKNSEDIKFWVKI